MTHVDRNLPPDLQRRVEEARRTGSWVSPRAEVVEDLLGMSGGIAPVPAESAEELGRPSGEVRSAAPAIESSEALVTRIFAEGELGLSVQEAADGVGVVIRGRVWLRADGHVRVLLLQGDHVLAMVECESGEEFRFDELEVPGWELEFHLPTGRVLRVRDF